MPHPRHWVAAQGELACEANRLMLELGCPFSGQPELKGAAVRLEALEFPIKMGAFGPACAGPVLFASR